MRFPYGICDFREIATKGYFYCDRTDRIPMLEESKSILFLRPRRFGKSLVLSMLANYYDIALADSFEKIFGNLLIGKNPTKHHNKYFILEFDFSCVDPMGSADDIKKSLYDHINTCISGFKIYYEKYIDNDIKINRDNALSSIGNLISAVRITGNPVYLLIDEYDSFANEVMMKTKDGRANYEALVYEEGPLKTLFKTIKSSAKKSLFNRTFITGVSPIVMSDITSGYNIAKNIYLDPEFNDLCGFTEEEIKNVLQKTADEKGIEETQIKEALNIVRTYYNGYTFAHEKQNNIYNPTLALYFFENFYRNKKYPRKMMDTNMAADESKLQYISEIPRGKELILELAKDNTGVTIEELEDRFGIKQMLSPESKDFTFMTSLLYYLGILTMAGETQDGEIRLKTPNLVTHGLYVQRIRRMLLPEPDKRDEGVWAAKELYKRGNIKPVCKFIENKFFKVFSNRDYRWANELTVKTAFLTLLYNNILYIMDSEHETARGYTDLTMIIRPDMRRFEILDVLLEFKFLSLSEAGLTGEQAKELSREQLEGIDKMQEKMKEAENMLVRYGSELEKKYPELRLKKFAVTALGFERLWAKEV